MGIYDGVYLYCDIDGTLLSDLKEIPEINIRAIKRFTEEGGMFGLATGRSPHNLSNFPELLPLNAPSILDNGGILYDVKEREFKECTFIPRERSIELANKILEICPTASLQLYTKEAIYQGNISPNRWVDPLTIKENVPEIPCKAEEVPGEWIKMVLCVPEKKLDMILEQLDIEDMAKYYSLTRSGKIYYEIFCLGMNKGYGIASLRKKIPEIKKILAIGDYYNDLEMLAEVDVAGAPSSAVDEIKAIADYITCDNNQGAVADFLRIALGMEI